MELTARNAVGSNGDRCDRPPRTTENPGLGSSTLLRSTILWACGLAGRGPNCAPRRNSPEWAGRSLGRSAEHHGAETPMQAAGTEHLREVDQDLLCEGGPEGCGFHGSRSVSRGGSQGNDSGSDVIAARTADAEHFVGRSLQE